MNCFSSSAKTKDEPSSKNPWKSTTISSPIPLKTTFPTEKETNLSKLTMARPTYITKAIIYIVQIFFFRPIPQSTRSMPILQPSSPQHDITKPWSILATSPPSTFSFGYSNMSIASSPPAPPMSFRHIQDQETRAHEALRQISNKSLEKIQVFIFFSFLYENLFYFLIDRRISYTSVTSFI
jgi:hypothetical protein